MRHTTESGIVKPHKYFIPFCFAVRVNSLRVTLVSFHQSLVVIYRFKFVLLVSQEASRAVAILRAVTVTMNTAHIVKDKAHWTIMVIKTPTAMLVTNQVHLRGLTVVLVKGHIMVEVAGQVEKEARIWELVLVLALIARLPSPPAMLMAMVVVVVLVVAVAVQMEKGGHTAVMVTLIAQLPPLMGILMTMVVSKAIQGLIQVRMILMMKNR